MVTRPSERCELRVTVVLFSFFPLGSSENTNKRIASYCIDSLSKAVAKLVFNRFSWIAVLQENVTLLIDITLGNRSLRNACHRAWQVNVTNFYILHHQVEVLFSCQSSLSIHLTKVPRRYSFLLLFSRKIYFCRAIDLAPLILHSLDSVTKCIHNWSEGRQPLADVSRVAASFRRRRRHYRHCVVRLFFFDIRHPKHKRPETW